MTDNIVARLRAENWWLNVSGDEAADEIERLSKAMRLSDACRVHAEEECEQLRAALYKMADCGKHPCGFCFEMAQVARAALAKGAAVANPPTTGVVA